MAAKNGISTNNCTIYITTAPCSQCAKLIVSSGIKRVVYHELYKENYGLKLLELCGVKADKI
jgi:dCMP deaminase